MNTTLQYQAICNLPELDIQEGGHGPDIDYIDFTMQKGKINVSGRFTLIKGKLEYSLCYQHDDERFDLEHVNENGEEYVTVSCEDSWFNTVYVGKNGIQKVEIEQFQSTENAKSYCFTLSNDIPLFELT